MVIMASGLVWCVCGFNGNAPFPSSPNSVVQNLISEDELSVYK
jgi:hypothetical protein